MRRGLRGCFERCMSCEADDRGGAWGGDRRRDGVGDDVRLYAGGSGGEVWIYGGEDRVCAGAGVGVFDAAGWGEAGAGPAADGAVI